MAIVTYLDTKSSATPLFGSGAKGAARVWEAVSQIISDVGPAGDAFADPLLFGGGKPVDADAVVKAAASLHRELQVFENRLASNPYLCGDALSAADLGLYPVLMMNLRAAGKDAAKGLDTRLLPLSKHLPNLAAWAERIEAIPGYDKTYPPHWRT